MTLLALSCLVLIKISNAGYALDDYSKEKCPICYNFRVTLPAECTGDSADETRTAACGEEELCYIMKLKEGAVPKGAHTNVHQGYNANFLCATEDVVESIKSKNPVIRDVAVSTPAPTGSTPTMELITKDTATTETADAQETTACGPGTRPGTETACETCPGNTYSEDGTACVECPDERPLTTVPSGATSASQCFAGCAAGTFLKNGECRNCKDHFYSPDPVHNTECVECAAGTAKEPGSSPGDTCTTLECGPGNYLADDHTCSMCPADTYSDQDHNTFCLICLGAGSASSECVKATEAPAVPTEDSSCAALEYSFLLLTLTLLIRL